MSERDRAEFEEVVFAASGKRCGLQWAPWMGDWFVSWSPRNSNSNAEGPWAHWAHLAAAILAHPFTEKVAPELFRPDLPFRTDLYADAPAYLDEADIEAALDPAEPRP